MDGIVGIGDAESGENPSFQRFHRLGLSVLEIAHRNDIDIEGACEGSLACSTCHVIVDPEWYELLQDASEDEEDMLDLAFGLTATSRLGCQIIITEELDGLTVRLPSATRNMLQR